MSPFNSTLTATLLATLAACAGTPKEDQTAPSRDPGARRVQIEEATALVRAQILSGSPSMNDSAEFPLVELTTDEIWRRLGVQLFKVERGVRQHQGFLLRGEQVWPLCTGMGGHGLQSACVTDLDGDGLPELTYTYSWGSGLHRSRLGVCRVDGDRLLLRELPMAYDRDLFVSKESDSLVTVEAGRYGWSFCSWETEAHLGELEASTDSEFLTPEIRLAPVSEEHAQGTWILETIEPC